MQAGLICSYKLRISFLRRGGQVMFGSEVQLWSGYNPGPRPSRRNISVWARGAEKRRPTPGPVFRLNCLL